MIFVKRRLLLWLIRAYIKRWGKIILVCFLIGLGIFFILKSSFPYIIAAFTGVSKETDGMVGVYTLNSLPPTVTADISEGLTVVDTSGLPHPGIANSWDVRDAGKEYVFYLKHNLTFVDGSPVTSNSITYSFAGVTIERPDLYTIIFKLKQSYSPFLVTVSRPIFKEGYVGLGPYRIKKVSSDGPFLQSLTLTSNTKNPALKIYVFYPTEDSLKVAYALGEVTNALNLSDIAFENTSFLKFPHTHIVKSVNYSQLVTLFYNTQDKELSDKRLRDALSYAMPNTFSEGVRANTSIPPTSFTYNDAITRPQDYTHAKILLDAALGHNPSSYPTLTITTFPKYEAVAIKIQKAWKKLGIQTNVQVVDIIPQVFQMYLGDFTVPEDPDQYTLWHSDQTNNITNFKNTRIDKLLEDGRKTSDITKRIGLYQDFQKYLQDEQPASFLFSPYNYTVSRN